MVMKTIRVSEETHIKLSHLGLKSETYNDIIERLIRVYEEVYFEDFSDEEAAYYNERIAQFEKGNFEGTRKVDLNAIRQRQLR
ncbi:MAG: hypothetical protein IJP12_03945 [Methanobrevibacter sp.]|nr:hypothetical protein [Methanobrevibacter sp.]